MPPNNTDGTTDLWSGYGRRRTAAWAIPVTFIAVAIVLSLIELYDGPCLSIVAVITLGALPFWFERWHCLRCRDTFTSPQRDLTYAKACQDCGLDLWETSLKISNPKTPIFPLKKRLAGRVVYRGQDQAQRRKRRQCWADPIDDGR